MKTWYAIVACVLASAILLTVTDPARADPSGRYRFDGPNWSGRGLWGPRGGLHFGRGEINNNEFFYLYGRYGGHIRGFVYSPDLERGWALGAGPNYHGTARWGEGFAQYRIHRTPPAPPHHYWASPPRPYGGTYYRWSSFGPGYYRYGGYCGPGGFSGGGFYSGTYGYSYYYRW